MMGITIKVESAGPAGFQAKLPKKFDLLADPGIITVPDDYDHATALAEFMKRNRGKLRNANDDMTDANFPNPTRALKPGHRLRVRVFQQIVPGTTTSEDRMAFLATQGAVHTGAQGLTLVFEQMRNRLPNGKMYVSFDGQNRLWTDAHGNHRVPFMGVYSAGGFHWCLGTFEVAWNEEFAFLCFCDVE